MQGADITLKEHRFIVSSRGLLTRPASMWILFLEVSASVCVMGVMRDV